MLYNTIMRKAWGLIIINPSQLTELSAIWVHLILAGLYRVNLLRVTGLLDWPQGGDQVQISPVKLAPTLKGSSLGRDLPEAKNQA